MRDSEVAATSSGVEPPVYKTLAFGISAAYAGVAGSLFVLGTNGFAQPNEFGIRSRSRSSSAPRSPGSGRSGACSSGPLRRAAAEISKDVPLIGSTHGQDVVFGLLVVLVMLLLPQGFAGFLQRLSRLRARA